MNEVGKTSEETMTITQVRDDGGLDLTVSSGGETW